jgi:hypothetical protein
VQWEYRKILLNEHHRREDDIDLLCDAGEHGWELVAITPNNVAYLKREVLPRAAREEVEQDEDHAAEVKPKYRDSSTGETWSGRGRMATWLKKSAGARRLMGLWTGKMRSAGGLVCGRPVPREDAGVLASFNDEPSVALTRHH